MTAWSSYKQYCGYSAYRITERYFDTIYLSGQANPSPSPLDVQNGIFSLSSSFRVTAGSMILTTTFKISTNIKYR